ncbi:redox-sensing transcriptional repressor Rex [Chitinispirillales bacterium ANBcel5]|uniref:redox-sensing transcriptional repressor Rex n=1 Tax=Cellulosispirillum alkaliphilum TaxID=3039283 RepID=UPI002A4F3C79|nr:redox-sensing transcriptional repressor Rex [Chitinispirillales bacterium ANBcel5]
MTTNKNCILRLSQYKSALYRFKSIGFEKIFSNYLADAVGVTSTQVRKDFSLFGISGNKRGGYSINSLISELNKILGKDKIQKVIIAGAGSLGSALIKYRNFEKEGIKVVAAFDIDPAKRNTKLSVPIYSLEELSNFTREYEIEIGILSVPEIAAQHTLDLMVKAGIKGVLNFAPIQLKSPDNCVINNVNLELELENLIYFVNLQANGQNAKTQ